MGREDWVKGLKFLPVHRLINSFHSRFGPVQNVEILSERKPCKYAPQYYSFLLNTGSERYGWRHSSPQWCRLVVSTVNTKFMLYALNSLPCDGIAVDINFFMRCKISHQKLGLGYQLVKSENITRLPTGGKGSFFPLQCPERLWRSPVSFWTGPGGLTSGTKRPERKPDYSTSKAEVKSECSQSLTPSYALTACKRKT